MRNIGIHVYSYSLESPIKFTTSLKKMCAIYKPDVLLLQEIVCVGSKDA
jgi:hypothetical protein